MVDTPRAVRSRAARNRVRRRRRRLLLGLVASLVVVPSVVALGAVGTALWRFGQIDSVDVPGLHATKAGTPFNVLVVGSDSRANFEPGQERQFGTTGGQRNDVTMVVRVDPGRRRLSLLSVPRDLVVPIAGLGRQDKFNAAFTGGPSRVTSTIEQNFGVPIHHYLLVDFNGFKGVVDALGGIEVNFPYPARDMDDQGRNMSGLNIRRAGCQRLDGGQALALARSRDFSYLRDGRWRWDPNGDLGRIRRQQAFLHGVLATGLAKGLTNPIRANAFVEAIVDNITKDKALDVGDAIGVASGFRSFKPSAMETYTVPTRPVWEGRAYRGEALRQPEAGAVVAKFLGQPPPAGPDRRVTAATLVRVRNAIGVDGLAARTRDQLREAGFRVGDVGNASVSGLPVSRIAYPPGELARAKALQGAILGTTELREDATVPTGELTLLLGGNFSGVQVARAPAPANAPPPAQPPATSGSAVKKPAKPTLSLRDYDPRPC